MYQGNISTDRMLNLFSALKLSEEVEHILAKKEFTKIKFQRFSATEAKAKSIRV